MLYPEGSVLLKRLKGKLGLHSLINWPQFGIVQRLLNGGIIVPPIVEDSLPQQDVMPLSIATLLR